MSRLARLLPSILYATMAVVGFIGAIALARTMGP